MSGSREVRAGTELSQSVQLLDDDSLPVTESGSVPLEIFDVVGQKVRTLTAEVQLAGTHRVLWDSHDDSRRPVAAGGYCYRLQVRDAAGHISQQDGARFSQVRKAAAVQIESIQQTRGIA